MHVMLRTWDRVMFKMTTGIFFSFKKNLGQIPAKTKRNYRITCELGPELIQWVLKFMEQQNINYIHLQAKGFNSIRLKCLQMIFRDKKVVSFNDTTLICWGQGQRIQLNTAQMFTDDIS